MTSGLVGVVAAAHSFVVSGVAAGLIAFGAFVVLAVAVHLLLVGTSPAPGPDDPVAQRRRGIKSLVIGADGRASTSKVAAVLWTFAVFFAVAFLLLWGRSAS